MPDLSLCFFLCDKIPHVEIIKEVRTRFPEIMQEIIIKISRSRPFQRLLKLTDRILARLAVDPCRVFGRKLKALSGITLHQRLSNRSLRAVIRPGRVKVCEPRLHEMVHHDFDLLNVDHVVHFGKAHHTEAQFFDLFVEKYHRNHPFRLNAQYLIDPS